MKKYQQHTLKEYLDVLSSRKPVPGGGSAAAYTGALGVALLGMVAQYSVGKSASKQIEKKIQTTILKCTEIQNALLDLVDSDAEAYQTVVNAKGSLTERNKAERQARKIPAQVSTLCYKAVSLAPFLVEKGNVNLISDVEVAVEMLFAAHNSGQVLSK